VLIVVALPLALLATSLRITTGHWLVRWEYAKSDFPPDPYGFTTEQRIRLADVCVDYLVTGADIDLLANLEADGEPAFNERELEHMVDVKKALWGLLRTGAVAGLIVAGGTAALGARPTTRPRAAAALVGGSLLLLGLLVTVGGLMVFQWQAFFTGFHELFFASGTWTFPYSDTLIRLFPIRFWMDVAAVIVGLLVVQAVVIGGGAFIWHRRLR
jgi:integral membrane protein (TIGR01906 family)